MGREGRGLNEERRGGQGGEVKRERWPLERREPRRWPPGKKGRKRREGRRMSRGGLGGLFTPFSKC